MTEIGFEQYRIDIHGLQINLNVNYPLKVE